MAYLAARNQIVSILEGTSLVLATFTERIGSSLSYGSASLRQFPDADEDRLPKTRGFWLRWQRIASLGPHQVTVNRERAQMLLTVCYRKSADPSFDDKLLAADYDGIKDALLAPNLWGRPSSTIITICNDSPELLSATIDRVEGAHLLRISFPMEYTA